MDFLVDAIKVFVGMIIGAGISIPLTISKCNHTKSKVTVKNSKNANVAGRDLSIEE